MWREAGQVSGSLSVASAKSQPTHPQIRDNGRSMMKKVEHQPLLRTLLPPWLWAFCFPQKALRSVRGAALENLAAPGTRNGPILNSAWYAERIRHVLYLDGCLIAASRVNYKVSCWYLHRWNDCWWMSIWIGKITAREPKSEAIFDHRYWPGYLTDEHFIRLTTGIGKTRIIPLHILITAINCAINFACSTFPFPLDHNMSIPEVSTVI